VRWGRWFALAALVAGAALPAQHRFRLTGGEGAVFGRPFELVVERAWPAAAAAQPFDEAPFHPLEVRLLDARVRLEGGLCVERRRYSAVALRSGEVAIGPFAVRSRGPDGQESGAGFAVPPLQLRSLLPEPPGDVEWPGDVRDAPLPARRWPYVAAMSAVLLVAALRWRTHRRRAAGPTAPAPAELARAALGALPVPDEGDAARQAFYAALAEIVRTCAGAAFAVRAEVRTSEELVARAARGALPLRRCLWACDLVKFAAGRPAAAERERAVAAAAEFVAAVEDGA
jgi:hypothetical protein